MRTSIGLAACLIIVIACSDSKDMGQDGGGSSDTGTGSDSAMMNKDSGGMDSMTVNDTGAGDAGLNGCTSFDDRSAPQAMRTITWQFGPTPKCIEIDKNQTVTWQGDFGFHPLEPLGGDMPTPITSTATGMSAMFTFPNSGFYGYHCAVHSGLEGVVHVK